MLEWVLTGFESGPLDPRSAPESLKITVPCLSGDRRCQLGPAVGQGPDRSPLVIVPLTFHSCSSPQGPPQAHGGVLGLGNQQDFRASLRTWGSWACLWVRSYEEQGRGLWGSGLGKWELDRAGGRFTLGQKLERKTCDQVREGESDGMVQRVTPVGC